MGRARRSRRVRVGTASWTDRTLIRDADWYPKKSMSAAERLRFYASVFSVVEADATYYFPPTEDLTGKWTERTPTDFRFDVKAYSLLTQHPTTQRSLWPDVAAELPTARADNARVYLHHLPERAVTRAFEHFRAALRPLYAAGKLGAVFFQFPPWFVASRGNRRYLESLPERLPDYPLAVEFRHHSWLHDDAAPRTLQLLEDLGLAYVCVDGPQGFDSSVPPLTAVTAPLAVMRFHGHNTDTWNRTGISAAERFAYLYSQDELAGWVEPIRHVAEQAHETHVVFNNCYRDYGVRNAEQMKHLLTSENTSS